MFDVWACVAELHQPCLHRLSDNMLGADGLVRREILSSMDRLLCEHLAAGRASFQAPPTPPAIPAEQRFLATSALQKSVRRGNVDLAMRYAQQGCAIDAEHVFRRLATIAVEDVGIGNLLAVGMALAVLGNRAMRENGGPDELAAYIAYLLAISPKSRLACDLLSIADYDRTLADVRRELAQASPVVLRSRAEDRGALLSHRTTAAWLLAGTARFRGVTMPKVSRPRTDIMRMMAAVRTPLMLFYIADRTAARLSDAMFVSTFLVAEMLSADPVIFVDRTAPNGEAMIDGYPAASLDLHTWEGRLALARFARECAPIAELLRTISPSLRDTAIRHGVFIAEGGKLHEQLRFAASDQVEQIAHRAELAFTGLCEPVAQQAFLARIGKHLSELNQLRRETVR